MKKQGLSWEDAQPIFETFDTVAEIEDAITDPEAFLKKLAVATTGDPQACDSLFSNEKQYIAYCRGVTHPSRGLARAALLCMIMGRRRRSLATGWRALGPVAPS